MRWQWWCVEGNHCYNTTSVVLIELGALLSNNCVELCLIRPYSLDYLFHSPPKKSPLEGLSAPVLLIYNPLFYQGHISNSSHLPGPARQYLFWPRWLSHLPPFTRFLCSAALTAEQPIPPSSAQAPSCLPPWQTTFQSYSSRYQTRSQTTPQYQLSREAKSTIYHTTGKRRTYGVRGGS